jgi:hypothetical protein
MKAEMDVSVSVTFPLTASSMAYENTAQHTKQSKAVPVQSCLLGYTAV